MRHLKSTTIALGMTLITSLIVIGVLFSEPPGPQSAARIPQDSPLSPFVASQLQAPTSPAITASPLPRASLSPIEIATRRAAPAPTGRITQIPATIIVNPLPTYPPTLTPLPWPTLQPLFRITDYQQLTFENSGEPVWSPDGTKIAYTKSVERGALSNRPNNLPVTEIWVMQADGINSQKIDEGMMPVWTSDGKQIVYSRALNTLQAEIWTSDLTGGGRRKLTDADYGERPFWTSDGYVGVIYNRKLLWVNHQGTDVVTSSISAPASRDLRNQLLLSPDGSRLAYWTRMLTSGLVSLSIGNLIGLQVGVTNSFQTKYPSFGTWSPDSRNLAFIYGPEQHQEVWVVGVERQEQRLAARMDLGGYTTSVTWSPDSRFIAFSYKPRGSNTQAMSEIYVVEATGSQPLRLTQNDRGEEDIAWSPMGNAIAFRRETALDVNNPGMTFDSIWVARIGR